MISQRDLEDEPAVPAVLLVEDDQQLADMYRVGLERSGMDVTVVADGDEAVRVAAMLVHDIVLLDLGLPKRDGMDVLRALSSDPATAGLRVLILSNYDEPALLQATAALGVTAYLVKASTTPAELAFAIRASLTG